MSENENMNENTVMDDDNITDNKKGILTEEKTVKETDSAEGNMTEAMEEEINSDVSEVMEDGVKGDAPVLENNLEEVQFQSAESNNKSKLNKKFIVGIAAVVIAIIAVGTVFAKSNLFKSNAEIILESGKNTVCEYFEEDGFLSRIFNSNVLKKAFADPDFDPSITISGTVNKFPDMPSMFKGTGAELMINLDKSGKEGNAFLKGVYNNIDLDIFSSYFDGEHAVFDVPISEQKFIVHWEDLSEDVISNIKEFTETLDKADVSFDDEITVYDDYIDDIISIIEKNVEIEKMESKSIKNIKCDVYKISLNQDEVKELLKMFSNAFFSNQKYMDNIKNVYSSVNINDDIFDDERISEMADDLENEIEEIDIEGVEMIFYVSGDGLVRAEIETMETMNRSSVIEMSFTGEDKLSDYFEFESYEYRNDKYRKGIYFSDISTRKGSDIANEKVFMAKGSDEKELGEFKLVTNYNLSDYSFDGYISEDDDSENYVEFSGTLESDDDVFDINFDQFKTKDNVDISFGLKVLETGRIDTIDEDGAIDIINDSEKFNEALENIAKNLPIRNFSF